MLSFTFAVFNPIIDSQLLAYDVVDSFLIMSAPSQVMEAADDGKTHSYVHTLAAGEDHRLRLLEPEKVEISDWPSPAKRAVALTDNAKRHVWRDLEERETTQERPYGG